MPTYRMSDLTPAEQARVEAAETAERKLNAVLPQYIAQMARLLADNTDLAREVARLRFYVAALEQRCTPEQIAAAVAEASAAVAELGDCGDVPNVVN